MERERIAGRLRNKEALLPPGVICEKGHEMTQARSILHQVNVRIAKPLRFGVSPKDPGETRGSFRWRGCARCRQTREITKQKKRGEFEPFFCRLYVFFFLLLRFASIIFPAYSARFESPRARASWMDGSWHLNNEGGVFSRRREGERGSRRGGVCSCRGPRRHLHLEGASRHLQPVHADCPLAISTKREPKTRA